MITEVNPVDLKEIIEKSKCRDIGLSSINFNGIEICVKERLTLIETVQFVNEVVRLCFHSETHEYRPEFKDFAIRLEIIEMYTNIDLTDVNTSDIYALVFGTEIIEQILYEVMPDQYNFMIGAIDKKVAHVAQGNIEAIQVSMNNALNKFENLEEKLYGTFDGVSAEDMKALTEAVSNGSFNDDMLVSVIKKLNSDKPVTDNKASNTKKYNRKTTRKNNDTLDSLANAVVEKIVETAETMQVSEVDK